MTRSPHHILLGSDVRAWREDIGLSLRLAAGLCGFTMKHLRRVENGSVPLTQGIAMVVTEAFTPFQASLDAKAMLGGRRWAFETIRAIEEGRKTCRRKRRGVTPS